MKKFVLVVEGGCYGSLVHYHTSYTLGWITAVALVIYAQNSGQHFFCWYMLHHFISTRIVVSEFLLLK